MPNKQRPNSEIDRSGIHLWVPTELYQDLTKLSAETRYSMTQLIIRAINECLFDRKPEAALTVEASRLF